MNQPPLVLITIFFDKTTSVLELEKNPVSFRYLKPVPLNPNIQNIKYIHTFFAHYSLF